MRVCRWCGAPLESNPRVGAQTRQTRQYCRESHRVMAAQSRRLERAASSARKPHRRSAPRTWVVTDFAALPDEFKVVQAKRVDRALAAGRVVPGVGLPPDPKEGG